MKFTKEDFSDVVGAVTIVTDSRIVFQGQIKEHHEDRHCNEKFHNVEIRNDPEFILLRLTCEPSLIRDNATIEEIEPELFEEGDIVRININEIVAVGPSRCCFEDDGSKEY